MLFKNLENKGNPGGQELEGPAQLDRSRSSSTYPVYGKDVDSFDGYEYLFWVGCAGAARIAPKKTTKAVAELLGCRRRSTLVLGDW